MHLFLLGSIPVVTLLTAAVASVLCGFSPTWRHPIAWRWARRPPTGKVIRLFGASVVHGRLGHDWAADVERALGDDASVINHGINGLRAAQVASGIPRPIAADLAVVMVGVNDVRAGTPIEDYRASLNLIVDRLEPATVALSTLTCIGDDPAAHAQSAYNRVIREVAAARGCECLDVAAAQSEQLREASPRAARQPGMYPLLVSACFQHYCLRADWDTVSARHGLILTTDTVHPNRVGASRITELVTAFARRHAVTDR
jgi:lysophospholipase L1-like esterase